MTRLTSRIGLAVLAGVLLANVAGADQVITGVTSSGAKYGIAVPEIWNGDLVIYGHGIVDPAAPVQTPSTQDHFLTFRDAWLARGFAVAYSSYSENGYALKDAVQSLHQLSGLFANRFGPPGKTYLVGHSLGAAAIQILAERYPGQYDAAQPMCGLLGGGIREVGYLGDVRVLFDYFFPGVLPGDAMHVPNGVVFLPGHQEFDAALNALFGGFFAPGSPTFQFALAAHLPFTSAQELVTGAMSGLGFNLRFTNDLLAHTNGHSYFDNTATVYPGAANTGAGRFVATADALNYLERYFTPTGRIAFPTLTLHTTRDPVVPLFHEQDYANAVALEGASSLLVQQTVNAFGHCNFTDAEVLASFDDLVTWVRTGVKPDGGDVTP